MKKTVLKITALVLCAVICLLHIGCGADIPIEETETEQVSIDGENADCIINGKEIYFVEAFRLNELKEPIAKLLSNVLIAYGEKGEIMGYEAIDPDSPAVPSSYSCALFDVTFDGVPELLLHPSGYFGSSGTVTYFAYDVYTGERVCEVSSAENHSICVYYNIEHDEFCALNSYSLRGGWSWRSRHTSILWYEEDDKEICQMGILYSGHNIDIEEEMISDEDGNETAIGYKEIYPNTEYCVYGHYTTIEGYHEACEDMNCNFIRIPETELVVISWRDIINEEDTYASRAVKMAEALVTSDQKFIIP